MSSALILTLLFHVTPAECKADPEWCACRRYIAKELNKCENDINQDKWLGWPYKAKALQNCMIRYEQGKIACIKNDGDLYPENR